MAEVTGTILVNVIATVEHEVQALCGKVFVGGEIAGLIVLAAAEGELEATDRGAGRRCCLQAPDLARFATGAEAVSVLATGVEAIELNMDRVAELGGG